MPEGSQEMKPWHPGCCEVPMWLIEVRTNGGVSQHVFECKVCGKQTVEAAENDGTATLSVGGTLAMKEYRDAQVAVYERTATVVRNG